MAWEDLSPEEQASWKSAYKDGTAQPTTTQQSGGGQQSGSFSLSALGQTLGHPLGLGTPGGLRQGMSQAQQNIANVPNAIAQSVFGLAPEFSQSIFGTAGEHIAGAASGALNFLTSPARTPEGLAMAAATGPLGKATQGMRFLPRLGATMGAQVPIGAGVAMATGGNAETGGLEGLAAAGFQAAGGKLAERFLKTTAGDVYAVGKAAIAEVDKGSFRPFGGKLPGQPSDAGAGTIEALNRLSNQKTGLEALSAAFQKTQDEIVAAIGPSRPIPMSASIDPMRLAALGLDPTRVQHVTGGSLGNMTETKSIVQWLQELKVLKAKVNRAQLGKHDAISDMEWKRVKDIKDGLKQAIGDRNIGGSPELVTKYEEAVAQYGHGKDVLDILHDSQFVKSSAGGGKSAMLKLQQYLLDNGRDYPQKEFPELYQAVWRGANPMLKADKAIAILPPRIYGGPGVVRFGESVPKLSIPIRVGTPHPSPVPPRIPGKSGLLPVSITELLKSEGNQ